MLVLPLPGNERMAAKLASLIGGQLGHMEARRFPDGESYVRIRSAVAGEEVVLVCTLHPPDDQFLRLVFTARALRQQGAAKVTLAAPYLAYMRQDRAFKDGEAVTSVQFASLISREFDALVTIDPHLHRHKSLAEIYSIPAEALHAGPLLAAWIEASVADPLVIGPDVESRQWVAAIAGIAPSVVLSKARRGDRDVAINFPDLAAFKGRQPVLVDDMISSGATMIEACKGLAARGFRPPVCVAVHAVFAEGAFEQLSAVAARVVTTNTIAHPTNAIDVSPLLAAELRTPRD